MRPLPKRAARVGAAVLIMTAAGGPAGASAQPPPESGIARPGDTMGPDVAAGHADPPPPTEPHGAAPQAGSCTPDALRDAVAEAKPISAEIADRIGAQYRGKKAVTCMKFDAPGNGAGRDAALAELRRTAQGTVAAGRATTGTLDGDRRRRDHLPIPQWCIDHAFDGWWGYRTSQCRIRDVTVLIYIVTNGVPRHAGTARALEYGYAFTSDIIDRFAFQITVTKYWGERLGNLDLASVNGGAFCRGDCKPDGGSPLRPGRFARNVDNKGESYWLSTRSEPGGIGFENPSWEWHVQYPFAQPSTTATAEPPQIRCDNAFSDDGNVSGDPALRVTAQPTIGAGCVFPAMLPVMRYSKTGFYPTLAFHIEAAQNSGLPGKHPGGPVLVRLQDSAKRRANGDKACPRSPAWPRPQGRSCDEYPFRSTYQGASTQTPQGTARTFAPPTTAWCEMAPAWGVPTGVTGPHGWSSCMIDKDDNSRGGAALGGFYRSNRLLDGDPFRVEITP